MRIPFTKLAHLLALCCLLMLASGTSQALAADSSYVGVGSFGSGPDSADGTFNGPRRVAVNTTSGKVYVVDSANDRVEVFAPNGPSADFDSHLGVGELDGPYGIAIDQSNGDVYVSSAENEKIVRFNEDGSVDNGFTSPLKGNASGKLGSFAAALAVDSTGDLLVADPGHNVIARYSPAGVFEESYDGLDSPDGLFTGLLDVAVDSTDRILVVDSTGNVVEGASSRVLRLSATGVYQASLDGVPQAGAVAFDPNTGYVLVGGNLSAFAGARLYVFSDTTLVTDLAYPGDNSGQITGLAVDSGAGADRQHVYAVGDWVFDCCGFIGVQVLGTVTLPDATIDPPSDVQELSAHLSGTVNPQGVPTGWHFEYSTDATNWTPVQGDQDAGDGTGDVAVSDDVSGLTHNTQYYVRLVATSAEGAVRISPQESFTTATIPPPTASIDAASAVTAEGAHLAGTVDPNGFETSFTFQVSSDGGATWRNAASGSAGSGSDATPVSADVSGLDPNTDYAVRLVAANAGGETTSDPPDATFTTDAVAPTAETTGANRLQPDSAQLNGRVNPQNLVTTYHFEWGTQDCASSACASVPVSDASAGSGGALSVVSQPVDGLDADTTYHYRLVATNAEGTAAGADRTFTTTASVSAECTNTAARAEQHSQLADCRAWEMVSPLDKNGADVLYEVTRTRASVNGDTAMFSSMGVFADAQSSGISSEYMAQRTGGAGQGWSTHSITPKVDAVDVNTPLFYGQDSRWMKMSDDLTKGLYRTFTNFSDDPNVGAVVNLYRRDDLFTPGAGTYDLVTMCPVCSSPLARIGQSALFPTHVNADYSEVYFENQNTRVADTSGSGIRLYKWDADTATVTAAGILPDGTIAPRSVAGAGFVEGESTNAISDGSDGHTRVYFGTPQFAFGGSPQELYMRVDDATTYQVNASERTDCADDPTCGGDDIPTPAPDSPEPALFEIASADGTRAFFTSQERLTDDAQGGLRKIYMYDASLPDSHPHNLTLVSRDEEPRDGVGEVTSVLGASADGAWVYFTGARSQFEHGAPRNGVGSTDDSIYVWHDGAVRYIATGEPGSGGTISVQEGLDNGPVINQPPRVSADGKKLLIETTVGMTGLPETNGLFHLDLYDADAHVLSCVSCGPAPPTTKAEIRSATGYGTVFPTAYRNHPLTADGRHVFFNTGDALVPGDTNGKVDAYEYDVATGEHHLLSSGKGTQDSYFMDATPDGSDVFVVSGSNLLGWDTDRNYDLYDVRVNGGFPEPTPAQAACLSSDECQGAPGGAPSAELPRSAGFSGAGNDTSTRCERLARQAKSLRRSALRLSREARRAKSMRVRRAKSRRATRLRKRGRTLSARARTCQAGLAR